MAILRSLASWLFGITSHFPVDVRPGVYIGLIVLLIWAIVRARRPIYNALLRFICVGVDFVVGLLLLPEFAFTRVQRANGDTPGPVILASSRVAEKVLDGAAGVYESHPFVRIKKRPPIFLIVLLLVASGVDYWLLHKSPPNSATKFAHEVWKYWVQFGGWTHGR
jgi:hypothetical protein